MKKFISTYAYVLSLALFYPVYSLINKLIYRIYFYKFNETQQWDSQYNNMESFQRMAFIIALLVFAVIYLYTIFNTLKLNRQKEFKLLIKQSLIVDIAALICMAISVITQIFGMFVVFMNIFAAIFTLPMLSLFLFLLNIVIGFVGVIKGICAIDSLSSSGKLSKLYFIHILLQFIPLVNLIDIIFLKNRLKHGSIIC